nr:zinc carboxypeptidase-like isoform X1 [Danaus plexippus plexippus]XP_032513993.1 zinc carboxypeptidase-like isoform X2 [Danaus plexippus plexippus]
MMWVTRIFVFIAFVRLTRTFTVEKVKEYKNYKYYDVKGSSSTLERLKTLLEEKDDSLIYLDNKRTTQLLIAPELEAAFKEIIEKVKLNATLLHNDISEVLREEKPPTTQKIYRYSWNAYYDVNQIYAYLADVSRSHPEWAEVIVGGKSYEGREIRGLRINTPVDGDDNPNKPVFFIESGIHAREWIAPATTTYFINQLLTSKDPNVTRLRDQFDWRIFPTVNPDGYHYSYMFDRYWRKTRSLSKNGCIGADPNRNWDYNWGQYSSSKNPCDYQLYAGSKPFSEIETRTLSSYISNIENLLFYVAFHSYASLLLVPYSDSTDHIDNYDDLVQIGNVSLEYGYKVNQKRYDGPGTAAETLYKASGGSMDWVRNKLNTPLVFTYELRGNSFHWPPSKIPEQGEEVTQMMLGLSKEARNLGYY